MTVKARTGIVLDDRYQQHQTGPSHPERPDRLRAARSTRDLISRAATIRHATG